MLEGWGKLTESESETLVVEKKFCSSGGSR